MKPEIPTSQFKEDEAARLIANYGAKPVPEKKQEIEDMLKSRKEQFLTQERKMTKVREAGDRTA